MIFVFTLVAVFTLVEKPGIHEIWTQIKFGLQGQGQSPLKWQIFAFVLYFSAIFCTANWTHVKLYLFPQALDVHQKIWFQQGDVALLFM